MKKRIVSFTALFVLFMACSVMAQDTGKKGASEKAYEKANENAKFKREEAWFDDKGKKEDEEMNGEEKKEKKIKKKRKNRIKRGRNKIQ
jgi:hypothetical protein